MSVLVEPEFFDGSEADLRRARDATSISRRSGRTSCSIRCRSAQREPSRRGRRPADRPHPVRRRAGIDHGQWRGRSGLCPLVEIFDEERSRARARSRRRRRRREPPRPRDVRRGPVGDGSGCARSSPTTSSSSPRARSRRAATSRRSKTIGVHARSIGEALVTVARSRGEDPGAAGQMTLHDSRGDLGEGRRRDASRRRRSGGRRRCLGDRDDLRAVGAARDARRSATDP